MAPFSRRPTVITTCRNIGKGGVSNFFYSVPKQERGRAFRVLAFDRHGTERARRCGRLILSLGRIGCVPAWSCWHRRHVDRNCPNPALRDHGDILDPVDSWTHDLPINPPPKFPTRRIRNGWGLWRRLRLSPAQRSMFCWCERARTLVGPGILEHPRMCQGLAPALEHVC
jgi:hypothetical protein